ncbi:DUF4123 domain-containing protein [Massilia sp. S19_KUP03_FR1]|uniref:DUF4123 domain-containing protein n=1 Tax=Massilia sp. S19_KUP03_FR1 TaxID=3025503 RepID=UPI002FCDBD63
MLIDPFSSNWQDRLTSQHAGLAEGRQLFLLIDGAFLPDFYREVEKVSPVSLLFEQLPACSEKMRSVSPFLVSCSPPPVGLGRALGKCSGWPMLSAIETPEPIATLAQRLAAWCIVENDGQRFNFRFPDTRRLPGLFAALSARQRGSLAGPARRWSWIGRDGTWNELGLPEIAQNFAQRPILDHKQFAAMVGDSEVDEAILLLRDRGPLPAQRPSEIYGLVSDARRVAGLCRFDPDICLDWCGHCLHNGVRLRDTDGTAAALAWRATLMPGEA